MAEKKAWGAKMKIISALAWVLALGMCGYSFSKVEAPERTAEQKKYDHLGAGAAACERRVREVVADTEGLEFASWAEWRQVREGDLVTMTFDMKARNAFGGLVWAQMACELRDEGDSWTVLEVSQQ